MNKGVNKALYVLVLAALVTGLLLAACGKSTTTTSLPTPAQTSTTTTTTTTSSVTTSSTTQTAVSTTTTSTSPTSTLAPKTTPSPTPGTTTSTTQSSNTPKYGGVLKRVNNSGPINLGYPATMDGSSSYCATPALEPIMEVDLQGRFLPTGLTTNFTVSSDGKTATLALRKGVKFHDGTDFNAAAVKWNLEKVKEASLFGTQTWGSVDVVDDYTVRLNLKQPDFTLAANLGGVTGFVVSPTAIEKNGVQWAQTNPVGTGPFKIKSFERDTAVRYEKNRNYWQSGLPYLDGIDIVIVKDQMVGAASLQAKEVHILGSVDALVADDLRAKGYTLSTLDPTNVYVLTPDSKNADSVLAKKTVREAMEYATDKKKIGDAIGYGFWQPLTQSAHSSWPAAYDPNIQGRLYDPVKAKIMLGQANLADGFKLRLIYENTAIPQDALVAVQAQWKQIGVDATLEPLPRAAFVETRTKGWSNGFLLIRSNVEQIFTNSFERLLSADGKTYTSTQRPPNYGTLLSEAIASPDYATYQERTKKVVKLVYDEATWMPVWGYPQIAVLDPTVHDAGLFSKENLILWTPEKAWLGK